MIPFGPWRPDAASPNSGFAAQIVNAQPKMSGGKLGYGPVAGLVPALGAAALSGDPRGDISLVKFDGTYEIYFGTATTIEQMDSAFQFTVIDNTLNVTAGDDISFCHFESFLLNSNTTDGFKAYNVETPAGNNAVAGAPAARFIFSANNVVFALDCDGNNRRMQSSGLGDHTAWDTLGADGKTFEDGGALIGGADLQNGAAVLFQDNALRLIQFGGAQGGKLYRVSKIATGLGAISARGIVPFNGRVFFLSSRGFYDYTLGGQPRPIGSEKVNQWFLGQVATDQLRSVQGWIDPESNIVGWRYDDENSICYDWEIGEWTLRNVVTKTISRIATAGYTVDGPYGSVLVDDNDTPVDDRLYQGGQPVLAALDGDRKYATFSGTPMEATLETSELTNMRHQRVTGVDAIVDTDEALVQLAYKQRIQDDFSYGAAVSIDVDGFAPVDEAGKVYGLKMVIPAGVLWTNAEGFDGVEGTGGGPR